MPKFKENPAPFMMKGHTLPGPHQSPLYAACPPPGPGGKKKKCPWKSDKKRKRELKEKTFRDPIRINLPKISLHGKHHEETGESRVGKVIRDVFTRTEKDDALTSYKTPRYL